MDKERRTDSILQRDHYLGNIEIDKRSVPFSFFLFAGSDMRLIFETDPVPVETYLLAVRSSEVPGRSISYHSITAASKDGKTISSDSVFISGFGSDKSGYFIKVRANSATLIHPLNEDVPAPMMRLWFRSFRSFRNPIVETSLGKLSVRGDVNQVNDDEVSGSISIQAHSPNPTDIWAEEADKLLQHMHRGLAFAHGGRLQTPRLDYYSGRMNQVTFFAGSGFASEFPVQHHLNHEPFIRALVDRYERCGSLSESLWTAVGWMHTNTTFDEIRFMTAMVGIELIIRHDLPKQKSEIISRAFFRELKKKMAAIVRTEENIEPAAQEILISKISDINRKTFSQKIEALFAHFGLSNIDFEGGDILKLTNLRNKIVHRGILEDDTDMWPSIILARELINRIILREIGFDGHYCCYINGLRDRKFPIESVS